MWTAGIRVFGRCAIYPVCEIIQPCTTQCIERTIRKAKTSTKTSMFKPSAQDFLTPFGTLQRYTTLFDSFTDFSFHFYATLNFFSIMIRLTDVQRGRAIALLMQGQRQQQVANHFGVNVSTIERLVRRLRETGHLADRPRPRHVGCVVWRGWRRIRPSYFRWGSGDEFFLRTSLGSLSIAQMVDVVCYDVAENLCRRLCCRTGSVWGWLHYGLGRHCSRDKITVDYCCGQYDRSKV